MSLESKDPSNLNKAPRQQVEESLQQQFRRLQVLHDIDHAILSIQGEEGAASTALRHIPHLVPHYFASSVVLIDVPAQEAVLLAIDFAGGQDGLQLQQEMRRNFGLDDLAVDLASLQQGQPYVVHDLQALRELKPLQQQMLSLGIRAYLTVPLRWGGELLGTLNLASDVANAFDLEHVQIAQEVANSLAVAIQQSRLLRAERQRRQEAEVMRDVMVDLASAGNLKQALEAILVHLHHVIHYDRAGLFLAGEGERGALPAMSTAIQNPAGQNPAIRSFVEDDPLVAELRRIKRPIAILDAQADPRFSHWPDMDSVRGWLGAPLLAGEEMLGFIALGSLQVGAYRQPEIEQMQAFASQVAQVLDKAWIAEQAQRNTEELEVLSSISFALDQAESGENTLFVIVDQVTKFFGASQGAFLAPDRGETCLAVKVCQDESVVGFIHPRVDDLLWQTLASGQAAAIVDVWDALDDPPAEIYRLLWGEARSAALLPVKSAAASFGVLCLAFADRRRFSSQEMRLFNAVAEIAGASLRRAVILEALERQVEVRTQHLSTLYHINAVASEPLELQTILEQLLEVTLDSLGSRAGAIHFLDERGGELYLAAHRRLPEEVLPAFGSLSLEDRFWSDLVHSPTPLVMPDIAGEPRAPSAMRQAAIVGNQPYVGASYIGAPIRAKGGVLGLLSLFGESILDTTTIEDITLFMTIADQIGSSVEWARLVKRAELAAVIEERQRLARELHDSVTQLLYSQVLFAGAGLKVLRQGNQGLAEQHLERIDQAAQQALKEMRLLVYQMRPSDYLDDGLLGALQRRLEAVEKRTGIDAHLMLSGELDLDEATEMALYRIAEEALNNTLKHAQASKVSVKISSSADKVVLEIADDGQGFDYESARRGGGMGLANMRERAAALGGDLQILTSPGGGARVIAEIEVAK